METPYRVSDTLLRSRVSRPKAQFCILSWWQGPKVQAANNAILSGLSLAQIQANTTRGSTPGLIDPTRGRAGGRIYLEHEEPEDDTESESDPDAEPNSGASLVEGKPLIAGPVSDGTTSSTYESQQEEVDDQKDGGDNGAEERDESGEKHDREETFDYPTPKRQRMDYNIWDGEYEY